VDFGIGTPWWDRKFSTDPERSGNKFQNSTYS